MKANEFDSLYMYAIITVILISVIFGAVMCQPYMESRTYNRLTGANTTAWDALWVELRVQDGTQK